MIVYPGSGLWCLLRHGDLTYLTYFDGEIFSSAIPLFSYSIWKTRENLRHEDFAMFLLFVVSGVYSNPSKRLPWETAPGVCSQAPIWIINRFGIMGFPPYFSPHLPVLFGLQKCFDFCSFCERALECGWVRKNIGVFVAWLSFPPSF